MAISDKKRLILNHGEDFTLKRETRYTEDGSTTIFIPSLNENYHSIHGAIQESMHVFINTGLKQVNFQPIKIFEVGFGTGLNCLLTYLNSNKRQIIYHTIERFPVEHDLLNQLNYTELPGLENDDFYSTLHNSEWNIEKEIAYGFVLKKILGDLTQYNPDTLYNVIYFDAFAPEVQPELWTINIFQKMYDMLEPGGILVTYCAKGYVRRNMKACSFKTERLPGPPGKWEMLRATKERVFAVRKIL